MFTQAIVEGQTPRVLHFLSGGVDLDDTGDSDLTALHRAVLSSHDELLEPLIQAGADINAVSDDFGTPLCLAALKGMHEAVCILLKWKANAATITRKLGTVLHCCILSVGGRRDTLKLLISAGALVTAQATIDTRWLEVICRWNGDDSSPVSSKEQPSLEQLSGYMLHNVTPALVAIRAQQGQLLDLLLSLDVNQDFAISFLKNKSNTTGSHANSFIRNIRTRNFGIIPPSSRHTYLSSCAMICDLHGVRLLLAKGAIIDHEIGDANVTALMIAAAQGSTEIVTHLLDHGASIDKCNSDGWTALHYASWKGNQHVVHLLCERGAAVDARNIDGQTPLCFAAHSSARHRNTSRWGEFWLSLQRLLDAGADINSRDRDLSTPLLLMLQHGEKVNAVILENLTKAGADTRLRFQDVDSILRLCMSGHVTRASIKAMGRGLGFSEAVAHTVCTHLASVRHTYKDLNKREYVLMYRLAKTAGSGHDGLRLVVALGGNIDASSPGRGWTAMHSAAVDGDCVAISRLLGAGASMMVCTAIDRLSPLAVAVKHRQIQAVRTLLQHGANPCTMSLVRKDETESVLDIAFRQGEVEILQLLREAAERLGSWD